MQIVGRNDQVAVGHVDGEAGVVGQALGNVGVEGQDAQLVDRGAGIRAEGWVPRRARLGGDRRLLLDTGGLMGMLGRGSSMSGGVGYRGDAAPCAQDEAGEQERDQEVTHYEWDREG